MKINNPIDSTDNLILLRDRIATGVKTSKRFKEKHTSVEFKFSLEKAVEVVLSLDEAIKERARGIVGED